MENGYNGNGHSNGNGYENGNGNDHYQEKKIIPRMDSSFLKVPMKMDRFFTIEGKSPFEYDRLNKNILVIMLAFRCNEKLFRLIFLQNLLFRL